jgi:ATP-dependent Clp protease adaptor protein ClpS
LQLKIGAAAVALMGHPVLSHAGFNPMLATAVLTPPVVTPPLVAPPQVAPPEAALPPLGSVTPDRESGGAAVMEKAPERVRKPSPRYKVLLHNDPVNSMEYVVTTLRQVVPSLSEQDAIAVMLEAHNTGIGLVIVCDIEPAEFYCETLKAKGLSSTIEPES